MRWFGSPGGGNEWKPPEAGGATGDGRGTQRPTERGTRRLHTQASRTGGRGAGHPTGDPAGGQRPVTGSDPAGCRPTAGRPGATDWGRPFPGSAGRFGCGAIAGKYGCSGSRFLGNGLEFAVAGLADGGEFGMRAGGFVEGEAGGGSVERISRAMIFWAVLKPLAERQKVICQNRMVSSTQHGPISQNPDYGYLVSLSGGLAIVGEPGSLVASMARIASHSFSTRRLSF